MTAAQLDLAWAIYRAARPCYGVDGWFHDRLWSACVERAKKETA